jgi:calcineurin-like phosphoesterase family protein
MLTTLKINHNPDNIVFFSDLHLGHDAPFIYPRRGFQSIEEHDKFLLDGLSGIPNLSDVIAFNLGDVSLKNNQYENFKQLSLIGFKNHYLLWGNHNSGVKQHYQEELASRGYPNDIEVYPLQRNNVTFCGDKLNVFINGTPYVLCHFPIQSWEQMSHNSIHLCGHSHGNNLATTVENKNGFALDVGVEVCLKFCQKPYLTLTQISSIMSGKQKLTVDHH